MKKFLFATVLATLGATAAGTIASAADLPVRRPPPPMIAPAPIYNWSGFYLGGHIGGAWADTDNGAFNGTPVFAPVAFTGTDGAFIGGVQLGLNYQFSPNWLIGVEGDASWTRINRDYANAAGLTLGERTRWLASLTGRLGYVWGPGMLYAKGGVAFRDADDSFLTLAGVVQPFTIDRSTTGWTIGGGLEYMIAPNWTLKGEYQYFQFDNTTITAALFAPATTFTYDNEVHAVKVGFNYLFNTSPAPAPIAARY